MSSLSAFHKMAYEQLSGKTLAASKPGGGGDNATYNDKENWEILPHMSYASHKNMMYNGSKVCIISPFSFAISLSCCLFFFSGFSLCLLQFLPFLDQCKIALQ